jgi:hypothetical protein
MAKALLSGMVTAVIVALLPLLVVLTPGEGQNTTQASGGTGDPPTVFGIDADPTGNGTNIVIGAAAESGAQCDNSADDDGDTIVNDGCGLGPIDGCISVASGATFDIDIFVDDVPNGRDLAALNFFLNYDESLLRVTSWGGPLGLGAAEWLMGSTPGSNIQEGGETPPDTDGTLNINVPDLTGAPSAEPPGSLGVLERYTLTVVGSGPTLTSLSTTPAPKYFADSTPTAYDPDQVLGATIAIDQPCPEVTVTPTPSGTATPTPGATETPTPTLTNLVAGWNYACYAGVGQPIGDALADISDGVLAVYRLGPEQRYERWFPTRPEFSTITSVSPHEALFLLMANGHSWQQGVGTSPPTSRDLAQGWNSVCYTGATKDVEVATANIAGRFGALYVLAPEQTWKRFIPGRPEISSLSSLQRLSSVLILVTQPEGAQWVFDP